MHTYIYTYVHIYAVTTKSTRYSRQYTRHFLPPPSTLGPPPKMQQLSVLVLYSTHTTPPLPLLPRLSTFLLLLSLSLSLALFALVPLLILTRTQAHPRLSSLPIPNF